MAAHLVLTLVILAQKGLKSRSSMLITRALQHKFVREPTAPAIFFLRLISKL